MRKGKGMHKLCGRRWTQNPWQPLAAFALMPLLLGCTTTTPFAQDAKALPDAQVAQTITPVRLQKPDNESDKDLPPKNLLAAAHKQFQDRKDGEVAVRIRAHVDGRPIFDEDVRQAAYGRLVQAMSLSPAERGAAQKQILEETIQNLIDREVILSDALAKLEKLRPIVMEKIKEAAGKDIDRGIRQMKAQFKVATDAELKALLKAQGMSLEAFRRYKEREFIVNEYMRSRIFPVIERISLQQIRDYYDEHPGEFQIEDRVKWQDIFIDAGRHGDREAAHAFAKELATRAAGGEDFAKLAQEFDNGLSADRNGEGIGQRRGEIKPVQAEALIWNLKDGEVGPIIEMTSGFHVIRLVKRDHAGPRPFDDQVQNEIKNKLRGVIAEREWKRIVNDLKRRATIEICP